MAIGSVTRRATAGALGACLTLTVGMPAATATPGDDAVRVPIEDFQPLPAFDIEDVPPDVAEVRDELLGPAWRDPDNVTMSWYGVSGFVASIGGHVFLFDSWEIIGATNDYPPIGRDELAALQPEAILVGHGDFDHAGDLGYVAGLAETVVVGSDEHCDVAEQGATREGVGTGFTCVVIGSATAPPPGELQALRLWQDVEPVTIMRHLHSAAQPPGDGNEPGPALPIFDPTPYVEHFADDPEELQRFLGQLDESNEGGSFLYHLSDGDFTLLWGDSSGPIFQSEQVRASLDALPGCVDVMSNAILGFDQVVSGFQDPRLYVEHAHPKVFLPTHGDAWAPVISAGQAQYVEPFTAELEMLANPPELDFLLDPEDYLQTRVYDVEDPRWVEPMAGSSCVETASVDDGGAADAPAPDDGAANGGSDAAASDDGRGLAATGGGAALVATVLLSVGFATRRRRVDTVA